MQRARRAPQPERRSLGRTEAGVAQSSLPIPSGLFFLGRGAAQEDTFSCVTRSEPRVIVSRLPSLLCDPSAKKIKMSKK